MFRLSRLIESWPGVILAAFLTSLGACAVSTAMLDLFYEGEVLKQARIYTPIIAFVTAFPFCIFVWAQVRRNLHLGAALQRLVDEDRLTCVATRDFFFRKLSPDRGPHGTILMIDIDHFKQVNDTYGHPAGDMVIRTTAQLLKCGVREVDLIARFGGEEFVAFLDRLTGDSAFEVAERLRRSVAETAMMHDQQRIKVTISIGVAELAQNMTLAQAIQTADQQLYAAKTGGRNQTTRHPEASTTAAQWPPGPVDECIQR
jgi:diguanylate cyclase (GGDEF)-like protein